MAETYTGPNANFTTQSFPGQAPDPPGLNLFIYATLPPIVASSRRFYMRGIDANGDPVTWYAYTIDALGAECNEASHQKPFADVHAVAMF
jgi:hypothetical protein